MGANKSKARTNFVPGEKQFIKNKGKDVVGVTENFQLHDDKIKSRKSRHAIELSHSDRFFRQCFKPMHLMNFQLFNDGLDVFVGWCF